MKEIEPQKAGYVHKPDEQLALCRQLCDEPLV